MNKTYIYPYKAGSRSARALADALGTRVIRREGSRFRDHPSKVIINWGSSELPFDPFNVLNHPKDVSKVGNKLTFFRSISHAAKEQQPRLVPWTDKITEAQGWLNEGYTVVARKVLTGHSGQGILIIQPGEELPSAPLYTQYVKKTAEFRVHIVNGEVIDVQRKIRDPDREPTDWKVRSHANGFIYVRGGFTVPQDVLHQAQLAVLVSGLDFGAADVLYHDKQAIARVLEINTAPGLEGQTVERYADAFRKLLHS